MPPPQRRCGESQGCQSRSILERSLAPLSASVNSSVSFSIHAIIPRLHLIPCCRAHAPSDRRGPAHRAKQEKTSPRGGNRLRAARHGALRRRDVRGLGPQWAGAPRKPPRERSCPMGPPEHWGRREDGKVLGDRRCATRAIGVSATGRTPLGCRPAALPDLERGRLRPKNR